MNTDALPSVHGLHFENASIATNRYHHLRGLAEHLCSSVFIRGSKAFRSHHLPPSSAFPQFQQSSNDPGFSSPQEGQRTGGPMGVWRK
jgi:hypothetical protein